MGNALLEAQNAGGTTGPYRRVYSNPGFSCMSANVYLPSEASGDIKYGSDGDTAFVYSGGWGKNGEAVDAGFQHSPTLDNWAPFVKYQGKPERVDGQQRRFKAGAWVQLTFLVSDDNVLSMTATGTVLDGTQATITLSLTPDIDGVTGWSPDGDGIVLKRMTTIAQTNQSFTTGTTVNGVVWKDPMIGDSGNANSAWGNAQTAGTAVHPSAKVVTVAFGASQETDAISLA